MNTTTATGENSPRLHLKIQMYVLKVILSSGASIVGAVNYTMALLWLMNQNFLSLVDIMSIPPWLEVKLQEGHIAQIF